MEAIIRLPRNWTPAEHSWSAILNHQPSISTVCEYHALDCRGGDPSLGLNVSSLKEFQWISTSQNGSGPSNWSWEVSSGYWYHIAQVNDGEFVTMYVDGSRTMRTATEPQHGLLAIPGEPWNIGMSSWMGALDSPFAGEIAEIRINGRALPRDEWLYDQR
ncbi:LamG-like jellyroll fold domain-containing protein [Arhodomonas sp. AD133]|uniref:LamG-like jellyroll fold domain-containing protein n=1 Tax=Arhodomonas sp. AD133 TaxID=3415009 RepID=UPI003EB866D5